MNYNGGISLNFDLNKQSVDTQVKTETVDHSDVAIIGMSGKFPEAENLDEFWGNLKNGMDCIRKVPNNREADYYDNQLVTDHMKKGFLNEIDKFDYSYFSIVYNEAVLIDPNQRLLLETTIHAIEDLGYSQETLNNTKVGVFVGFSSDLNEEYKTHCFKQQPEVFSRAIAGNLKSVIASRIAYYLNLKGPSMVVDTACSSSLVALHLACQSLKEKECQMAIVGSVNLDIMHTINAELNIGVRSSDGRVKAFDDSANGTGDGEGVISIILKPLKNAIKDHDHIYAVVKGSAVNQDGKTIGITAPNPESQAQVITDAWRNAKVNPETITYIEAHGTGTKLGDPIEMKGLQMAFEKYTKRKQFCAVGSVKTNIGHLGCAAGLAGLVKVVLSLNQKKIPPHINLKQLNSKISCMDSPVYINRKLINWDYTEGLRRCGISSFGMSGTNCHVVVEEAPQPEERPECSEGYYIFCLSALEEKTLRKQINEYSDYMNHHSKLNLMDVCYTASTGRKHFPHRLAIVVGNMEDLKNKLDLILREELGTLEEDFIFYRQSRLIHAQDTKCNGVEIYEYEKREYTQNVDQLILKRVEDSGEHRDILSTIAQLYVQGADVNWKKMYRGKVCNRISLPSYPFLRTRCWVASTLPVNQEKEENQMEKEEMDSIYSIHSEQFTWIENDVKIIVSQSIGLPVEKIDVYMNFFEMGLDSILLIDIIGKINKKFGVEIPGGE